MKEKDTHQENVVLSYPSEKECEHVGHRFDVVDFAMADMIKRDFVDIKSLQFASVIIWLGIPINVDPVLAPRDLVVGLSEPGYDRSQSPRESHEACSCQQATES